MNQHQLISIQQSYFPEGICFGCGPANKKGLRINSFPKGDKVICDWNPEPHHQAFTNVLNGGIIGAILDCHCNWTAAYHLMKKTNASHPPCTVTAEYTIKLLKPTPADKSVHLEAWPVELTDKKAVIKGRLMIDDEVYDTCQGVFIAVKPGHPGYHRW